MLQETKGGALVSVASQAAGWSDRQAVGCTGMMRPNRDFERRWDFRSRRKSENISGKRCV